MCCIFPLLSLGGDNGLKDLGSLSSALFFTVSLHLQHPHPTLPRHSSSRVMVVFLLLYTLILSKSYSCNLTAFLTVSRQPTGIETIQELYESRLSLFESSYFIRDSLAVSPNVFLRVRRLVFILCFHNLETH